VSAYGYLNYYTPPKPPKLAQAAASKDPYGLVAGAAQRVGGLAVGAANGFATPLAAPKTPGYTPQQVQQSLAANPYASKGGYEGSVPLVIQPQQTPTAAGVNSYDLSTDPALQQIQSLVGQSNEQANQSALKQRQNLLLAYGDPAIAEAVLGAGDPIAAAAGQNPTSTVHQLATSRDRNLQSLDDQLNAANLGYSGYRVTQEGQAGQDYQNALAQAAAGLNSNLDQVSGNLAAALAGNNQQIVAGINSAADRASANAAASGTDPGALAQAAAGGGGAPAAPAPAGGANFAGAPQLQGIGSLFAGVDPNQAAAATAGAGRSLQGIGGASTDGGVDTSQWDAAARLRKLMQLPG
jgi:hypothetical protein